MSDVTQKQKTWMWGVRVYNKFFKRFFSVRDFSFCPRLLSDWQHLARHNEKTESLTNPNEVVIFAVMNYLTLRRLFLTLYNRKKLWSLLKRGKQTPISPTNTSVDEEKETGIVQLAQTWKQFFLRTQFLHTLIAPIRIKIIISMQKHNPINFVFIAYFSCIIIFFFYIEYLHFFISCPMRINKVSSYFILNSCFHQIPSGHLPPLLNHIPDPLFSHFSEHNINNKMPP